MKALLILLLMGSSLFAAQPRVQDLADAVSTFYGRQDTGFVAATYVALSCAEASGAEPLRRFAGELLSLPSRARLERSMQDFRATNFSANRDEAFTKFSSALNDLTAQFFRQHIARIDVPGGVILDCFNARSTR